MTDLDDLAHELHAALHEWMAKVDDWGDDPVYRLVWTNLDGALALTLAYIDGIPPEPSDPVH